MMPHYMVNITLTVPAWYRTEADSEEEAIAHAESLGAGWLDHDMSAATMQVDSVELEDE